MSDQNKLLVYGLGVVLVLFAVAWVIDELYVQILPKAVWEEWLKLWRRRTSRRKHPEEED